MMFDTRLKKEFPKEWQMSLERTRRNRCLNLPKGRLQIPGIGSVPRPHMISTENLFDILLNFLMGIGLEDQFENEEAKRKFNKAKMLYEQEVISLMGTWSDGSLEFISLYKTGYRVVPTEEKLAYLKRLRKSSIASYW